eukprot:GHVU01043152.1.p2 GENE.GHVU01043152.1~~GHVU01043152.1.p2  ORF type:complete len:107 (+),score=9.21 GHVU01043152.1:200-520(+)
MTAEPAMKATTSEGCCCVDCGECNGSDDMFTKMLPLFEELLDVQDIIMLRQCNRSLRGRQYTPFDVCLSFRAFRGYDSRLLSDVIVPVACAAVADDARNEKGVCID